MFSPTVDYIIWFSIPGCYRYILSRHCNITDDRMLGVEGPEAGVLSAEAGVVVLMTVLYPEWPHRQGGCLACCGCTFDSAEVH